MMFANLHNFFACFNKRFFIKVVACKFHRLKYKTLFPENPQGFWLDRLVRLLYTQISNLLGYLVRVCQSPHNCTSSSSVLLTIGADSVSESPNHHRPGMVSPSPPTIVSSFGFWCFGFWCDPTLFWVLMWPDTVLGFDVTRHSFGFWCDPTLFFVSLNLLRINIPLFAEFLEAFWFAGYTFTAVTLRV